MCLTLSSNKRSVLKKEIKVFIKNNLKRGKVVVYKIMVKKAEDQDYSKCDYYSAYMPHAWKAGLNSSDRQNSKISGEEESFTKISYGFHFFCKVEDAQMEAGYLDRGCETNRKYVVFKFHLDPKDIVAVGSFGSYYSLVATQAFFKRINLMIAEK